VGYGRSDPHSTVAVAPAWYRRNPSIALNLSGYLQKNWTELVEQASQMYCEGSIISGSIFSGTSGRAQPCRSALGYLADSVLFDLRLLLKRLPGLEGLAWNDGTPLPTKSPPPGSLKK
jgi:hypothetical protein